jgi:hypothetical protein
VDDGRCRQAALRRRQDLQGDFAEGHPAGELLVVHALRHHDALDARHTAALPARGSQSYPSPAAEPNADGSTTVYFSPTQPAGVKRADWIQTMPGKGFFPMLRLYSPLEPFFAKTWRPSEVEVVK